jgi:hypothetical protein
VSSRAGSGRSAWCDYTSTDVWVTLVGRWGYCPASGPGWRLVARRGRNQHAGRTHNVPGKEPVVVWSPAGWLDALGRDTHGKSRSEKVIMGGSIGGGRHPVARKHRRRHGRRPDTGGHRCRGPRRRGPVGGCDLRLRPSGRRPGEVLGRQLARSARPRRHPEPGDERRHHGERSARLPRVVTSMRRSCAAYSVPAPAAAPRRATCRTDPGTLTSCGLARSRNRGLGSSGASVRLPNAKGLNQELDVRDARAAGNSAPCPLQASLSAIVRAEYTSAGLRAPAHRSPPPCSGRANPTWALRRRKTSPLRRDDALARRSASPQGQTTPRLTRTEVDNRGWCAG